MGLVVQPRGVLNYPNREPLMKRTKKVEVRLTGRPVWAEVRLSALEHNFRAIQRHVTPPAQRGRWRRVLAVVKANAYGHGAVPVAKALARAGADWFGVTCTDEGAELREAGIRQPILVLTGFWPGEERRLLEYGLTPVITRCDQLRHLDRAAVRLKRRRRGPGGFHLKIETGMSRLGPSPTDADCFARELASCRHLRLEGTFTHFASSDVFTAEQCQHQEKLFCAALERLSALGPSPGIGLMPTTPPVAPRPATWAAMARPGAILSGYH